MNTLPTVCPFCGGELYVTHIYCRECDTNIEGRFIAGIFAQLKPDQLAFVENFVTRLEPEQLSFIETFVRCEGKIKSMEAELGLSYPTIRNRLNEVIEALGYEPGGGEEFNPEALEARRLSILEELDAGRIGAEEAMRLLQESEV
jgi:hypothetical protein